MAGEGHRGDMEDAEAPAAAPLWRRDGARHQRYHKRSAPTLLLPITPVPSITPGGLVVPAEQPRVMYLAPLTCTSAEKYIARSKNRRDRNGPTERGDESASNSEGDDEDDGRDVDANQTASTLSLSPVHSAISKMLRKHLKSVDARNRKPHILSLRSSLAPPLSAQPEAMTSPKCSSNGVDKPHNDQLERLKLQIHSLPATDDEMKAFKATLRNYQRLKLEYRTTVLSNHASPISFNMEAAWNKKLLERRHQLWVHAHEERIDMTKLRKAEEDEKYERHIFESTTEYRTQLRVLREVRMRLVLNSEALLPVIMLAGATQIWLSKLLEHWRHKQFQEKLSCVVRNWRKNRTTRSTHTTAAHLLINWLQKSVAVKTVAFKVFRGIRNYIRYVKKIQRLWKVKQAKRLRNYLLVERMWIEHETDLVDRAIEEHEKKTTQIDHATTKKKKTKKTNSKSTNDIQSNENWLFNLPVTVREAAIKAFLRDMERKFTQEFRQQEEDLYPHLVQTLRCENPNRARSYVKAMAKNFALLGRVYMTLRQYPGEVDDMCPILPLDMLYAPIHDLIIQARSNCPADLASTRTEGALSFGYNKVERCEGTLAMQNDQAASAYIQKLVDEDARKQFQIFLEKRHQYRAKVVPHPGDATSAALNPKVENTTSGVNGSGETMQVVSLDMHTPPLLQKSDTLCLDGILPGLKGELDVNATRSTERPKAYGLVAVCSTFKHLPSLSDKTKDIANKLFHALVDSHFSRFSRRGTKLLINPSVIEFQDTMKELRDLCGERSDESAFFLCLISHGARIESGVNEGSYVLFHESRLSSEEELLLTGIHERDLAKIIHEVPCKNKLLALELCQLQQAKEKPSSEAPTIRNRIGDDYTVRLYNELIKAALDKERQKQPTAAEAQLRASSGFNTVLLESCNIAKETPVRCREDSVSNFLRRLSDAFHGAAIPDIPTFENEHGDHRMLMARQICAYVRRMVERDANEMNAVVKDDYKQQLRTKYEQVAEFHEITHTPQLIGLDTMTDFVIGDFPAAPELQPKSPVFKSSTLSSVTLTWRDDYVGFRPSMPIEVPTILGFHLQIKGAGRACEYWRRAGALQVLSFEEAVRKRDPLPQQLTVNGLASDTGYHFRIRACTAGGWGPFSEPTAAMKTKSVASVHDTFSTVHACFHSRGTVGLRDLMGKHKANRGIQLVCIEFLVRLASNRSTRYNVDKRLVVNLDALLVSLVLEAKARFPRDGELARQACLFLGHLSLSSESWRKKITSITTPSRALDALNNVLDRFRDVHREAFESAMWAIDRVRGVSQRARLSPNAAARRIQGLYRTRKARELARLLAQDVYHQMVDPYSGRVYVYNSKTGATSWQLPSFLG